MEGVAAAARGAAVKKQPEEGRAVATGSRHQHRHLLHANLLQGVETARWAVVNTRPDADRTGATCCWNLHRLPMQVHWLQGVAAAAMGAAVKKQPDPGAATSVCTAPCYQAEAANSPASAAACHHNGGARCPGKPAMFPRHLPLPQSAAGY